jgi:hypothetical protein
VRKSLGPWHLGLAAILGMITLSVCAAKSAPSGVDSDGGLPKPPAVIPRPKTPSASTAAGSDAGAGPKTVTRRPAETPEQLGARVLPSGAQTITPPVEFELPPLGKVVLVLYDLDSADPAVLADPSIYRGIVLVPDVKPATYRIERLPSLAAGFGTLMYEVKSVFAADADGDGAPEICILSEIAEVGAGDSGRAHTDTDLFKWTGSAFVLMRQSDKRPLYNLPDAKAVRARLKRLKHL